MNRAKTKIIQEIYIYYLYVCNNYLLWWKTVSE